MNSIAQTFTIAEPENGVEAIFLTAVDLYFQSKSSTLGVEVQIRTTDNGFPTPVQVPYASKILASSNVNVSQDSNLATTFTFDTPVILETNVQYAIVVMPLGQNPDYKLWTAKRGDRDVSTGSDINWTTQNGNLFIPTNDINFTPAPLESMKFKLYRANFSSSSGTVVYKNSNTDFFVIKDVVGEFQTREQVVLSTSSLSLGHLNITGTTGSFTNGEVVYQSSSGASPNTAVGKIFFVNTSVIKVENITGTFVNTGNTTVRGASSLATATVVTANQYIQTYGNASISVPYVDHPDFANGNYIYVGTSARANVQVLQIIGNNSTTNVLTLSANINFANDTASFMGGLLNNGNTYGYVTSQSGEGPNYSLFLGGSNVNTNYNFANSKNKYLIGKTSGTSANVEGIYDIYYDSITSQFEFITPEKTSTEWKFSGTSNSKSLDTSNSILQPSIPYEFIDKQRLLMSRSNELANAGSIGAGNSSLRVYSTIVTSNTKISPYINKNRNSVTLTHNSVLPSYRHRGYRIEYSNSSGTFAIGDTVWQANSTVNTSAIVYSVNSSVLMVTNVTSSNSSSIASFNSNGTSTITSNSGGVANVDSAGIYHETLGNIGFGTRYISKNIILADGQDAEDLVAYITAYRPAETDFEVYGKFSHSQDSTPFNYNHWSRLIELSDSALRSSVENRNDLVELKYSLPSTVEVYAAGGGISVSNTSSNATFSGANTTDPFRAGDFIYFADKSFFAVNAYIANAGSGYSNGDEVMLTGTAGYLNANATFTVSTNATGNVISLTILSPGNYSTNTAISANSTSNVTGIGTGLTITVNNFNQSTLFDVKTVVAITNSTSINLSANASFTSGNLAVGYIPGLQSPLGAFKYTDNAGIARYISADGSIFDTFKTFSVKIVMTSNASQIAPRMSDVRCLALQV